MDNKLAVKVSSLVVLFSCAWWPTDALPSDLVCREVNGQCQLAWDFSDRPKATYDIERLDVLSAKWDPVSTRSLLQIGVASVEGGALYRVHACNVSSTGAKTDCESSNVLWVPVFPAEEEIPSVVTGVNGEQMIVHKNLDLAQQIEQYNVYVFVNMLDALPVSILTLPPMTEFGEEEAIADDGRVSLLESMQWAFFVNYSEKQRLAAISPMQAGQYRGASPDQ